MDRRKYEDTREKCRRRLFVPAFRDESRGDTLPESHVIKAAFAARLHCDEQQENCLSLSLSCVCLMTDCRVVD